MIISFSVENFRSFSVEQTFSLVANGSISTAHPTHALPIPQTKGGAHVLQAAVIYGANGAGKSNLFKALRFMRDRALWPRKKNGTGREAFALGKVNPEVSSFDIQFIAEEKVYRFGFRVDDTRVTEEWLFQVTGAQEKSLYERVTAQNGEVTIETSLKGKKLLALATVGGPQNQTFLATVRATLNPSAFGAALTSAITWLERDLVLIAPNESFHALGHHSSEHKDFLAFAGEYLKASSTGVSRLALEKEEITEDDLNRLLPEERVTELLEELNNKDNGFTLIRLGEGKELFLEKTPENHYYRVTLKAVHENKDGRDVLLELAQESDGTRRLLNLLPALHHLRNSSAVYFIDEIDRSMHPILVVKFLEFFLKACEGGKRQIIVTTHESNLLDLQLLRRDEIWFAEKDSAGATQLYSLVDFRVRTDLQIRKHYLQGRFGAIPFLGNVDDLMCNKGDFE